MRKINIKLITFAVVFLASNILITFHNPSVVFAATEAEEAADRDAGRTCDGLDPTTAECFKVYKAGYLGKKFPKTDGTNPITENSSCKTGYTCGAIYAQAINERRKDFIETPRQICQAIVNTAQGSDHLGTAYKDLKDRDKGKAITACAAGFQDGMSDFARGCQNRFGGRAPNDIQYIACLTGSSVADRFIFTSNEARAFAQGDDVSEVGDGEGAGGGQGTEEIQCEASIFSISWIICAVIEFGANFTNWFFNSFLRPLLEDVPVSLDPSEGSFRAWQGFRLLANIMLVASMLAIVYAQARGDQ